MPATFGMDLAADFSKMDGTRALQISDVVHQALVAVDEEGTEATAATAVVMAESAMMAEVEMTTDRPFIFLIRDDPTSRILSTFKVSRGEDAPENLHLTTTVDVEELAQTH
jgi:serpin B